MGSRGWRIVFAAAVVASLVILFKPGSTPPPFAHADKVIHFALFATLAGTGRLAGVPPAVLALALAAYAGGSEIVQGWIGRSRSAADVLADIAGVAVGLAAVTRRA